MGDPAPNDRQVSHDEVQRLTSREAVAAFFSGLGYNTEGRIEQTAANLGITADSTARNIKHIELVASQPPGDLLQVYLFEVRSVTVALTRALCRNLVRNRTNNFLLVLTSDYDRIDFVLAERYSPDAAAGGRVPTQPRLGVRPRVLSVERRKPNPVDLRVLRRFTYTEPDALAQYEKLRSAFSVAWWSSDHFDNRALFADYYLTKRLPEHAHWSEDATGAYRAFASLCQGARSRWGDKSEGGLREGLLRPAFEQLGFTCREGKSATSAKRKPDYRLYADVESKQPLTVCLTYPWDRFLDGKDPQRDADTPEENPGAVVVSLLEKGEADWIIVTNGKHWRLYWSKAHSRATNYYQVDLEEILALDNAAEAFRYFWLFFRRQAFEPVEVEEEAEPRTFLDDMVEGSREYAKRLEDRLKVRIFDDVFPHLAAGFVEGMRQSGQRNFPQETLDQVYQGTLTLLYRLLFLLYAEARDLLPTKEARHYGGISLSGLKQEIAGYAKAVADDSGPLLKRRFRTDSYDLYDRLMRLFQVIDRGDATVNVPIYNGGLFLTRIDPDDDTDEAVNAQFLLDHKVPDRHLATALDFLARDEDDKTFALVAIDYKSLGVRQLGSIYEGLLEYKLRIAPRKMAIVRGKKTEEVVPYAEAVREGRKILKEGRGKSAKERTYRKGEAYLETDRRERKATGSYYTPDHIVKYIVEHAVGPVLAEKFEACRKDLRKAQRTLKKERDKAAALNKRTGRSDKPEREAFLKHRDVVEALFDTKVLDPAMGSGHFLVEAVDFITDRMIDFLNAFPWNPVLAYLQETRDSILSSMEDQGITIDPARLTDVNLLKRHVLKRCIYGVDLNPMAVELAKVSLWLDCFTLGAPLSFLDHHLCCGNSLIGSDVATVSKALERPEQMSLFHTSEFARMLVAVDLMRAVGELSDVTPQMVSESRAQYRRALDALAPAKRVMDIYTSRWFGNEPFTLGRGKAKHLHDPTVDFLLSTDNERWIIDRGPLLALPEKDRRIAETASGAATNHRFFHWELEFPEVFFGPARGSAQAVERIEGAGFDAVIGNPPYVRQEGLGDLKVYLKDAYSEVYHGVADIYVYFYSRGHGVLRDGGRFGMVTSNKFMRAGYGAGLRRFLVTRAISDLIDFRDLPLFEDAISYPLIFVSRQAEPEADHEVRVFTVPSVQEALAIRDSVPARAAPIAISSLREDGWTLMRPEAMRLLEKIRSAGQPLGQVIHDKLYYGVKTGFNEAFVIDEAKRQELIEADPRSAEIIKPLLRGRDIKRWRVEWGGMYLIKTEIGVPIRQCPAILDHLNQYRQSLKKRWDKGKHWWELRACDYYEEFEKPKIVYQEIATHQRFAYARQPFLLNNKCFFIPTADVGLLGLLNSALAWWYLKSTVAHLQGTALALQTIYMSAFPVPEMADPARASLASHVESILSDPGNIEAVEHQEQAIDQIVYRLYGLTDEEIGLVEGE